jgi:hypothetical protein
MVDGIHLIEQINAHGLLMRAMLTSSRSANQLDARVSVRSCDRSSASQGRPAGRYQARHFAGD